MTASAGASPNVIPTAVMMQVIPTRSSRRGMCPILNPHFPYHHEGRAANPTVQCLQQIRISSESMTKLGGT